MTGGGKVVWELSHGDGRSASASLPDGPRRRRRRAEKAVLEVEDLRYALRAPRRDRLQLSQRANPIASPMMA